METECARSPSGGETQPLGNSLTEPSIPGGPIAEQNSEIYENAGGPNDGTTDGTLQLDDHTPDDGETRSQWAGQSDDGTEGLKQTLDPGEGQESAKEGHGGLFSGDSSASSPFPFTLWRSTEEKVKDGLDAQAGAVPQDPRDVPQMDAVDGQYALQPVFVPAESCTIRRSSSLERQSLDNGQADTGCQRQVPTSPLLQVRGTTFEPGETQSH